jgi:hypothetical protein
MDLRSKRPSQKYTRFSVPTSQTPTPSVHSGSKNLKYGAGLGSAMPNSGTSLNIASTSSRTYRGSSTRNTSAPQPQRRLRYFISLFRFIILGLIRGSLRAYNGWPPVVADSGSNVYVIDTGMPFGPPPWACHFCQEVGHFHRQCPFLDTNKSATK